MTPPTRKWWKSAAIYQIYPASFCDSTGTGKGDLPGILSKLDYIQSIGMDAVWISPFYESPDFDVGYDISDYQKPDPAYGKLEDIEAIIKGCHDRGMKILFDLVINHTSHLHAWFKESRKSKDNPYRKYYHWVPARIDKDGNRIPPTNWKGEFGGSPWIWDESTQEYYLAFFTPEQPDLNWEHDDVRAAIYENAILFWLEKGVDGFRIDTAAKYSKWPFVDVEVVDPHNYVQPAHKYLARGPRLSEFLQEMNRETFDKYDSVTIGELGGESSTEEIISFTHEDEKKFSMMIRFDLPTLDHHPHYNLYPQDMPLSKLKATHKKMQEVANPDLRGWLVNYFENHDQPRIVSRWCDDSPGHRVMGAKMLAINIVTLSGTLLVYEGQEIGMSNIPPHVDLKEYIDIMTINNWRDTEAASKVDPNINLKDAWRGITKIARDHARTPMQWDDSKNGGFSTADKTWMLVNESYKTINVAAQEKDPRSVLNFWRALLKLRKQYEEVFVFGAFHLLDEDDEKTFSYLKTSIDKKEVMFVTLNFTGEEQPVSLPEGFEGVDILISASDAPKKDVLQPWEGRVYLKK